MYQMQYLQVSFEAACSGHFDTYGIWNKLAKKSVVPAEKLNFRDDPKICCMLVNIFRK